MSKSWEDIAAEENKSTPWERIAELDNTATALAAVNQISVLTEVAAGDFRDDELAKELFDFGPDILTQFTEADKLVTNQIAALSKVTGRDPQWSFMMHKDLQGKTFADINADAKKSRKLQTNPVGKSRIVSEDWSPQGFGVGGSWEEAGPPLEYEGLWRELARNVVRNTIDYTKDFVDRISREDIVISGQFLDVDQLEVASEALREIVESPKMVQRDSGDWRGFVTDALGSQIPYMGLSTIGYMVLGPIGAFGVGSTIEGEAIREEELSKGASEDQANLAAFIGGSISGAIETLQIGTLFKGIKQGKAGWVAIGIAAREKSIKKLLVAGGKLTLSQAKMSINEAIQESLQEYIAIEAPLLRGGDTGDPVSNLARMGKAGFSAAVTTWIFGTGGNIKSATGAVRQAMKAPLGDMSITDTGVEFVMESEEDAVEVKRIIDDTSPEPVKTKIEGNKVTIEPMEKPVDVPVGEIIPIEKMQIDTTEVAVVQGVTPVTETIEPATASDVSTIPTPAPKPTDIVKPNLYIGNLTARAKAKLGEAFGKTDADVEGHLDPTHTWPTKRTPIEMTRYQAEKYLTWAKDELDRLLDKNLIKNDSDLASANAIHGDVNALEASLGLERSKRPFTVVRAQKNLSATIDTTIAMEQFSKADLVKFADDMGIDSTGTKAELLARMNAMATKAMTKAQLQVYNEIKKATDNSVKVIRTVKESIKAAIHPGDIIKQEMTGSQILQAVMKKAEQTSSKAWRESAKNIMKLHKDVVRYIKDRMRGTDLTRGEQNRLLSKVAQAKDEETKTAIVMAVEMMRDIADRRNAKDALKEMVSNIKTQKLGQYEDQVRAIIDSIKWKDSKTDLTKTLKGLRSAITRMDPESVGYTFAKDAEEKLSSIAERDVDLKTVSVPTIEMITDTLGILSAEAKNEGMLISRKNAIKLSLVVDKTIREAIPKLKNLHKPTTFGDKIFRSVESFFYNKHAKMEDLLDNVVGGMDGSYESWKNSKNALSESVYGSIDAGVTKQDAYDIRVRKVIRGIFDDLNLTAEDIESWAKTEHTYLVGELTENEMMSIYMHSRNAHNARVLIDEGIDRVDGIYVTKMRGFTTEIIDQIVADLSPKQKTFAKRIGDEVFNDIHKNSINEVSQKLLGVSLAKIDNYWSARRAIQSKASGKSWTFNTIEGMGLLKERIGTSNPLLLRGFVETLEESNRYAASYVGLAESLRDAKTVVNDKALTNHMESIGRKSELDDIKNMIEVVENNSVYLDDVEKFMSNLVRNSAKSIFNLNPKLAGKQQISETLYGAYAAPEHMMAIKGYASKEFLQKIFDADPQTQMRLEHMRIDRDLSVESKNSGTYTYFTGIEAKGTIGLRAMRFHDGNAIADGFRIAHSEVLADLGSEQHPDFQKTWVARAKWLVRHTQPTWNAKDRSLIGSSTKPMTKMFTMFMSQREKIVQMLNNANVVYLNADKTTDAKKSAAQWRLAQVYGSVLANTVLVSAYNVAWVSLLKAKAPEMGDFIWDWIKGIVGLNFFGNITGAFVDTVRNKVEGWSWYEARMDAPPIHVIRTGVNAGSGLTSGIYHMTRGEDGWEKELKDGILAAVESYAMSKGLPYYGPASIIKAVGNYAELQPESGGVGNALGD
jgi:hypothetical protein